MASIVFLPDPNLLTLVGVEKDETMKVITAFAMTTSLQANCPLCQQASRKVHSSYQRTLSDLPCFGQRVRWLVQVRRFFCQNASCERKIFTERLPSCAPAYARRTLRLASVLCEVAFTTGGKAGEYLARLLGMTTSHDTLLRLIRRSEDAPSSTPRVLGVDDFAWKKGQTYGTILVDHEKHEVVDLLADREAETLLAWLKDRPGIEIINRDRASAYAEAARLGAPNASQTADRFHLLLNLREALQRLLERKRSLLPSVERERKKASQFSPSETLSTDLTSLSLHAQETFQRDTQREKCYHLSHQAQKQVRHAAKDARFREVRVLYRQGLSVRAIARTLGMARKTVQKYLQAELPPEYSSRARGPSKLDPFVPYLVQRWSQGPCKGVDLSQEIRAQGYTGSQSLLAIFLADLRRTLPPMRQRSHRRVRPVRPRKRPVVGDLHLKVLPGHHRLSPKRASFLLVSRSEKLTERQQDLVKRICQASPLFHQAYLLAQTFVQMLALRTGENLVAWLTSVEQSGLVELKGFAQGIRRDLAAVIAALSTHWNNGQTEGQVNRLKLLKRQSYGRANFDLLRLRVLHASRREKSM